jgi:hypothetical protein
MRWFLLSVLLLALSFTACSEKPAATPAAKEFTQGELDQRLNRNTPEGTLRVLIIGMQVDDAELIESLVGPLKKDELQLLQSTERPTLSKEIQLQQGAALTIRHLQPGDKVPLDDGREFTIPADELNSKSQWLMIQGISIPLRLHKHDNRWQVDVAPLIAARRAAKARTK